MNYVVFQRLPIFKLRKVTIFVENNQHFPQKFFSFVKNITQSKSLNIFLLSL